MPRGGARKGAGRPKGKREPQTLQKIALRKAIMRRVGRQLPALLDAQISNALGIKYLVVRDRATGKFNRVAKNAAENLKPTEEIIEIWEERPNVQAFTDLMNRTVDKPSEHVEMDTNLSGELKIISELPE
jgi:hypothetical protein